MVTVEITGKFFTGPYENMPFVRKMSMTWDFGDRGVTRTGCDRIKDVLMASLEREGIAVDRSGFAFLLLQPFEPEAA